MWSIAILFTNTLATKVSYIYHVTGSWPILAGAAIFALLTVMMYSLAYRSVNLNGERKNTVYNIWRIREWSGLALVVMTMFLGFVWPYTWTAFDFTPRLYNVSPYVDMQYIPSQASARARAGETIHYDFCVTNTESEPMYDVTLCNDSLSNVEFCWDRSTDLATGSGILAPGESVSGSCNYVLTETDIKDNKYTGVKIMNVILIILIIAAIVSMTLVIAQKRALNETGQGKNLTTSANFTIKSLEDDDTELESSYDDIEDYDEDSYDEYEDEDEDENEYEESSEPKPRGLLARYIGWLMALITVAVIIATVMILEYFSGNLTTTPYEKHTEEEQQTQEDRNIYEIQDYITYENLTPGKEYVIRGDLVNADTGESLLPDGYEFAESRFIPDTEDGTITVKIKCPVEYVETALAEGVTLAISTEITEYSEKLPALEKSNDVIDTVKTENTKKGKEYTVCGKLIAVLPNGDTQVYDRLNVIWQSEGGAEEIEMIYHIGDEVPDDIKMIAYAGLKEGREITFDMYGV